MSFMMDKTIRRNSGWFRCHGYTLAAAHFPERSRSATSPLSISKISLVSVGTEPSVTSSSRKKLFQSVSSAVWLPTVQSVQCISLIRTPIRCCLPSSSGHNTSPGGSWLSVMAVLAQEGNQCGEDVLVHVFSDEYVLMAVAGKDVQLMASGRDLFQAPMAVNVGVHEDTGVLPLGKQDGRRNFRRMLEIVVGERRIANIGGRVFDGGVVALHHLQHVAVVVHSRAAEQIAEAFMRFRGQIGVIEKRWAAITPHETQHVAFGRIALLVHQAGTQRKQLAHRPARLAPP